MTLATAHAPVHREAICQRHSISVDVFRRMGEAGIFEPGLRVELIEGELIDMAPISSRHAGKVNRLVDALSASLHGKAMISAQNPIALGEFSEPQPDIAVLRQRDDYYETDHPTPADIYVVIEVAETSARYDREIKIPLYGRHGITEVWLFDLEQARLEVYHSPQAGEYRHVDFYRAGSVALRALPDVSIELGGILS